MPSNYSQLPREEIEQGVNEQTAKGVATLKEEVRPKRSRKTGTPAKEPSGQVETVPAPEPETDVAPKSAEAEVEKTGPESTDAATSPDPAGSPRPSEPTPEPDVAVEPTPPENAPPPAKPLPDVIPAAAHYRKGRGGHKHKALQEQIKLHANGLGFRASIEAELPGKSGSVDVLLETQSTQVAIEIALRSPIDQEIRNIAKALENSIPRIVVVSDNSTHLGNIREAAENANLENLKERVRFIHSDEIGEFLNTLRSSIPDSETTTRGYIVRAKYNKLSEHEMSARKDALHRAVSEAERRLNKEERE